MIDEGWTIKTHSNFRRFLSKTLLLPFVFIFLSFHAIGQIDDFCREAGVLPGLDLPRERVPYVYGKVTLLGLPTGGKVPRITVILNDTQQISNKQRLDRTGNYCFRRAGTGGGSLTIAVDGLEVARRSLPVSGPAQQREDFEVYANPTQREVPPAAISAKFVHPPNEKTSHLYRKVLESERGNDLIAVESHLLEIVLLDPTDFVAWAKLGTTYIERSKYDQADAAFRKSLELKMEYTPAWINVGKLRMAQKQFPAAIEILKHAVELDPTSARAFQLLGEAYLQNKQGTLGAEALNQALKLDAVGMAECHLLLARLYDLAGAKHIAAAEYRAFLEKVPGYSDRRNLEKYIKENSVPKK